MLGFMSLWRRMVQVPQRRVRLFAIDFQKTWLQIFWAQRWLVAILMCSLISYEILDTLFPLLLRKVIASQSLYLLAVVLGCYLLQEASSWFIARPLICQLYAQVTESFRFSAYRTLLAIDPMFHSQQSSGVSMGKIRRTTEAYPKLLKKVLDDLCSQVVMLITTMISVFFFSARLGFLVLGLLTVLCTLFVVLIVRSTRNVEVETNRDDDLANHVGTETIVRFPFIRSSFASDQMLDRLTSSHLRVMRSAATLHMTHSLLRSFCAFSYLCVMGVITAYALLIVRSGELQVADAIALLVTILRSTQPLLKLDKYLSDILSSYRKIADFYAYIRGYGKQSFPVFSDQGTDALTGQVCIADPISVSVDHVSLAYAGAEPIFSDLSLHIVIPRSDMNKLYGIIGPSGIGKTTFISLLGGQLKPNAGHVLINGCDLYALTDAQRQRLIALQGQVATNLFGDLRTNITFGLPGDHGYCDSELVELLESVGLWHLFSEKEGLDTMIGEGGMTLSGGQRQRLNFANLFLRAKVYRPSIILIDEPTSSLDEVSELRITQLITELAHESLTLVIAHRLKTLENAQKILDFCLVQELNEMTFYEPDELQKRSPYYRQLIFGEAKLEAEE